MRQRITTALRLGIVAIASLLLAACSGGTPTPPKSTANILYVNPDTGQDSNPGTVAEPLKTLGKALSVVQPGKTIVLFAGTYDQASGESWDDTVPIGTTIKANASGVVLQSASGDRGLTLAGDATIQGITFKGFFPALLANAGALDLKDATFDGNTLGLALSGNAKATLDTVDFTGPGRGVDLSNTATLAMSGGNVTALDGIAFYATDSAAITLDSVHIANITNDAVALRQSALAALTDCVIDNSSSGTGTNMTSIDMSDSSHLSLTTTTITASPGWALIADGSGTDVQIDGGTFSGNGDTAIETSGTLSVDAASVTNNGGDGIRGDSGSVVITNTTVSGSANWGVEVADGVDLFMRGDQITSNTSGILLSGSSGSADLGTAASPGNSTVQNATTNPGLATFRTASTAQAAGNTWLPNVQGADSNGHYGHTLVTGPVTGENLTVGSGATLQL